MTRPGSASEGEVCDDDTTLDQPLRRRSTRTMTPLPSAARAMVELLEGSPVGEYEIQDQIGEGAMGTVYSAVHPLIGKTVAIKVLKPELCANQASIDRFVQEAQAVNQIGHPNIVDVFSLGELPDGRAYMVMEWLRGEDLKIRLAHGPITVPETCDILDGIARALDAAHANGIIHRDLKPDNVFLHHLERGPVTVKLLDFGIAKLMRTQTRMEKTQTGNMLGTPRYISPEQARGIDVTPRSDVYSLGVMAYEMLAGRPPFQGETAMDLVVKHLNEPPPPLSQLARVPRALERCVMAMLAKDPARRPSLEEVRLVLGDPTQRLSQSLRSPGRSLLRWPVLASAAVIAAALVFFGWRVSRSNEAGAAAGSLVGAPASPAPVVVAPPPAAPAPAPARGRLDIDVTGSSDALILVDGVVWGRGGRLGKEVEPGGHDIEIRATARRPIRQHVVAAAGQVNTVAIVVPGAPPPRVRAPIRVKRKPVQPPPDDGDGLIAPKGHP